jgi:excisionase family DNA binding protein
MLKTMHDVNGNHRREPLMTENESEQFDKEQRRRWREYLTTQEVADRLRTSPETVRYWRHRGEGPPSWKCGRRVLYSREDLDRWIAAARSAQG